MIQKLIEVTVGAFRHVVEKHALKNCLPVGFSVVFYNKDGRPQEKWFYDMRVIIDKHDPAPCDVKAKERITLVNEFLAEGVKRILEGEMDEMIPDKQINDRVFQIPGMRGKA